MCTAILEVHAKIIRTGVTNNTTVSTSVAVTQLNFESLEQRDKFAKNLIKNEDLGHTMVHRILHIV
ncbi:hypothetical protein ZZ1p0212 [Acinetobacter phage ZZ1]|jgi:hypothetical protein|uniref:Uncharacterized protein n=2 Tax=Caudoviricetes TaxID=2731619 RepID=I3WW49_9CAUD|nr:hypothetical protein ZZ1p0212 [Acinetobacter phage ZZ1]AFL47719.1 hypothetical protein ZZ1p0212 [Acinetobacter phage ZZ1]